MYDIQSPRRDMTVVDLPPQPKRPLAKLVERLSAYVFGHGLVSGALSSLTVWRPSFNEWAGYRKFNTPKKGFPVALEVPVRLAPSG